MAIFQTKKIQSFIVFIIVLAAILWIFQDNILNISVFKKTTEVSELSDEQIKDTSVVFLNTEILNILS